MLDVILARESKSLEDKAFEYWLRTGTMLRFKAKVAPDERKFNPYHDPDDGRFTFAPGAARFPSGARAHLSRLLQASAQIEQPSRSNPQREPTAMRINRA